MTALRARNRFVVSTGEAQTKLAIGLCPACPFMTLRFEPPEVAIPACS
jgi:hypothetical protein